MTIPVQALESFGTALALQAFRSARIEQGRAKIASQTKVPAPAPVKET